MPPSDLQNASFHEENSPYHPSKHLHALTRLILGGAGMGVDELFRKLDRWEQRIDDEEQNHQQARGSDFPDPNTEILRGRSNKEPDLIKYALIGFLFETEDQLSNSASTAKRVERAVESLTTPITRPLSWLARTRLFSPLQQEFNGLVNRGEDELSRWIMRGQFEISRSRKLAQLALNETIDESIGYLTNNPEVQELVQTQSTGLANEVIEEVRERTVSADTFLESLVRTVLRRSPRKSLPEPPSEVRQRVTSQFQQQKQRGKPG